MQNLLEQLENNEVVLLMYLAGELPDEDREEVSALLATDKGLRDELENLRATMADANALIGVADSHGRLPIAESVAVRNTLRSMRRWRLEHPPRMEQPTVDKGLRYAWWLYPSSAAAMLLIAALVWWGVRNDVDVSHTPSYADAAPSWSPDGAPTTDEYAQVDGLDQAYTELRHIQELANGL